MASLSLVNEFSLSNTFNPGTGLWEPWLSQIVAVPAQVNRAGYVTVIVSAGKSAQNIYDLGVYIERSPDGGDTWIVQDSTEEFRDARGANEALALRSMARIETLAGQQVRVRVKLGGCTASVSGAFSEA